MPRPLEEAVVAIAGASGRAGPVLEIRCALAGLAPARPAPPRKRPG